MLTLLILTIISTIVFSNPLIASLPRNNTLNLKQEEIGEVEGISEITEGFGDDTDTIEYTPDVNSSKTITEATSNPTTIENQEVGTENWRVKKSSNDTTNEIKGYANKVSINKGESIDLKVSVNPKQKFNIEVYRIGWYQGLGGRLMQKVGPLQGTKQPNCPKDNYGTIECKWSTSHTLNIPTTWVSGAYLVKIINEKGYQNWINFTLRDDSRTSDILFQNSVNTLQAYNQWGGRSLYTSPAAHKVSFDRPYYKTGSRLQSWEIHMIFWLEKNGYDVSYSTDVDTHTSPDKILNHKAFLSVGHNEYWTWEMMDNVENARNKGVNLGFFGGNDAYWQVRYEKSSSGIKNRVIVGYKDDYKLDPNYRSSDSTIKRKATAQFRYSFINRPEQKMIGTLYFKNLGTHDNNLPMTVLKQDHWIYKDTGLKNGDKIPNVYGYEYNRFNSSYAKPKSTNYTILSKGIDPSGGTANSTIYTAPSGAMVFSAGTTDWSWLLERYGKYNYVNPLAQKITANIINKFISTAPISTP